MVARAYSRRWCRRCKHRTRNDPADAAPSWNGKSLSSGYLAQIYGFTDLDGSRIVFEGTPAELVAARSTLTGEHLAAYVGT